MYCVKALEESLSKHETQSLPSKRWFLSDGTLECLIGKRFEVVESSRRKIEFSRWLSNFQDVLLQLWSVCFKLRTLALDLSVVSREGKPIFRYGPLYHQLESAPTRLLLATSTLCNATIGCEFWYIWQPISGENIVE